MKKDLYILSLGGSIIVPDDVDTKFVKKFRKLIISEIKKGKKFIIITGGGKVCRRYQHALGEIRKTSNIDRDWMGIHVTRLNAQFMKLVFDKYACDDVVLNPEKKVRFSKPILIGAGWEPGWSTDYDAVLIAKTYGAKTIVNLSNITKIYTKDPNKYKNAKPIDRINWQDFRKIVGNKWVPGKNTPFDPIASKLAQSLDLRVVSMNGRNMDNFKEFLKGKNFVGSVIEG